MYALIVLVLLSGCETAPSDLGALPGLVSYSAAEQAQAADEIEALPEGSVLARMIGDYAVLRAQVREGK